MIRMSGPKYSRLLDAISGSTGERVLDLTIANQAHNETNSAPSVHLPVSMGISGRDVPLWWGLAEFWGILSISSYTLPISMDWPGCKGRSAPDIHILQLSGKPLTPYHGCRRPHKLTDYRAGDLLRIGNHSHRRKRLCIGLW